MTEVTCYHCGAAVPSGVVIREKLGEECLSFCCRGCHGAYLLITGAGLENFYRTRETPETGLAAQPFETAYQDAYLSRFVYPCGAASAIDLIIEGMSCASCIWLNEKIVGRLPGVERVRVNYATGRARVLFDPGTITPETVFSRISALGYLPRPYTPTAAHEGAERERRDLLIRFGTAFFLTMQLMAYAFALYAGYFQGIGAQMKGVLQLFSLVVTTPVVFYCGWPFLSGAWRSAKNGAPDMELLIAIGTLSSYGYSIYASLAGGEVYFETAAMIVTLILAGRLLENAAKRRAAGGVQRLMSLTAVSARRVVGSAVESVEVGGLAPGDLVVVGPGERFPVDGVIEEGTSDVDEAPVTGEALPVAKGAGDRVLAGSTNLTGTLHLLCESGAAESFIGRVARLVEEAQSRRAPIQGVADRVAAVFVPLVLALSVVTFLWYLGSGATAVKALMNALSVVVIACPCALGLATPTAIMAGTGAAAALGVSFQGGDFLERLSRVSVVVFDKTGTLTRGTPAVTEVRPAPGLDAEEVIALAAAAEAGSLHPIGRALCACAAARGIAQEPGRDLQTTPGGGVTGVVGAAAVAVGSARFLAGRGVAAVPQDPGSPGETAVYLARDGRWAGTVILRDEVRGEAERTISYFAGRGIRTELASGDRVCAAAHLGTMLGIDEARGELSPAEKAERVRFLKERGERVLMVGDGINDAPALGTADLGCAIAGGTDIALETSDLVLARPDLARLSSAHRLARRTMAVVRQNLVWAFLYNVIGIPLAMTGRLTPVYAAAAMALSSLCVVGNSLRLTGKSRG